MMNVLDKLYRRSEGVFIGVWIAVYVILASYAGELSRAIGVEMSVTALVLAPLCLLLWLWMGHAGMRERYGLRTPLVPAARMLFYLPAVVIAAKKLLFGIVPIGSAVDCAAWVVGMAGVSLMEELLFRGLLFQGLLEEGRTKAIVISSLTFGMGHIVNLVNGNSHDLVETLCQIAFAVSVGFMLVMMLLKSGSIWPCVIFHVANNGLSAFANEAAELTFFGSQTMAMLGTVGVSLAIATLYILYLRRLPDAVER